jgi:hypothetical protein
MPRKHLFTIVVLLGAAAVAGMLALTTTGRLGASATQASDAQIAARSRSLDRLEASLRRSLAKRPPAVPAVRPAGRPAAQRTIFVRPTAVSAQTASHEDEHEVEYEHEGGDD